MGKGMLLFGLVAAITIGSFSNAFAMDSDTYTWNYQDPCTEAVIEFEFVTPLDDENQKQLEMMVNAWLANPKLGEDFWDVELHQAKEGDVYPIFGTCIYPDDIYHAVKTKMMTEFPHEDTIPYQGLYADESVHYR